MQFTSIHFLIFFCVVLLGLGVLRDNRTKIPWLILAGCFFYGYWDWKFLLLLAFTSIFDFYMGIAIESAAQPLKKRLLILDIFVNLGILCIFKYLNFFIDSFNAMASPLGMHFHTFNVLLPLGISFFVFEAMSYCIDIYRGNLKAYRDWRQFALFIFFFPRLIAGPIIRPSDFLPQLQHNIRLTMPNFCQGMQLFLFGLTKKLVIADNLAPYVDAVFASPSHYSGMAIWQATIAYSIQIFCDFSGYSDMAIGLAKILGFDLPVNFRMPYLASSVTDFWRRWHISLSSWLRDYLYISLGGNRHGVARTYLNLLITMALGGLWHGANWHFVIWGVLHGLGLAVHKFWMGLPICRSFKPREGAENSVGALAIRFVSWAITYLFVCLCWVFFRSQTLNDSLICLSRMFGMLPGGLLWVSGKLMVIAPIVVLAHIAGTQWRHVTGSFIFSFQRLSHVVLLMMWIAGIFFLGALSSSPFIYFQF